MIQRDYQLRCIENVLDAKAQGIRSVLIVVPTGCGKTAIASWLIKAHKGKSIFVVHRQELATQARDAIESVAEVHCEIEMGELRAQKEEGLWTPAAQVIVSSVQTLTSGGDGSGRMSKFMPEDFEFAVFDESHHATSKSWRKVKDYLFRNPKLFLLGVTATPDRGDEEALEQVFDKCVFKYDAEEAIQDGWLVPIEPYTVPIESLDYSKVRTTAGELNGGDLDRLMRLEKNMQGIVGATYEIVGHEQGIGFTVSVEQARIANEIFNRWRPGMSAYVHGGTDKDERRKIVADFKSGQIQWLWNCNCFGEGFDYFGIKYIALACATKSRARYAQWLGRGTRPHESVSHKLNECPTAFLRRMMIAQSPKPFCTLLDFPGNNGNHKLITPADILGGKHSPEVIAEVNLALHRGGKFKRIDKMLEEEEKRQAEKERKRLEDEAKKSHLVAQVKYKMVKGDLFNAIEVTPQVANYQRNSKEPTEAMQSFLRKHGFNPAEFDFREAGQLIGEMKRRWAEGLATLPQLKILRKWYDRNEIDKLKFDEASSLITRVRESGWRKVEIKRPVKLPVRQPQEAF